MKPSAPFLLSVLGAVIVVVVLAVISRPAHPHSWYEAECCHSVDCKPVDAREIGEDGDRYTYQGMSIPKRETRPSMDQDWHPCVIKAPFGQRSLRCLYRPTPGS